MDLTVIITTINEAENLGLLIPPLRSALDAEKAVYEILVIDGPSTDGTPEIARSLGCKYFG